MRVENALVSVEGRKSFLKGLIRVAKTDGTFDANEWEYYQQAAQYMELSETDIQELNNCCTVDNEKITLNFTTSSEKMFFLVEAVQLCWVNDEYSDAEKREIHQIAKEVGISKEALKAVEDWVYEGMEWNKRGDELLNLK